MINYKNTKQRRKVSIDFTDSPSLTEQTHKDQVKIQNIVKKHGAQAMCQHVEAFGGTYQNLASMPEFHDAQNIISEASSMFETIPARIRLQFNNDPATFLGFIQDPKNVEDIKNLGFDTTHLKIPEPPKNNQNNQNNQNSTQSPSQHNKNQDDTNIQSQPKTSSQQNSDQ